MGLLLIAWVSLASAGPVAGASAIEDLAAQLADKDAKVRSAAVKALVAAGKPGWDRLGGALHCPDSDLVRNTMDALVDQGPRVVPAMLHVAGHWAGDMDAAGQVVLYARSVMERLGPGAIPALKEGLNDADPLVRRAALTQLCYGGDGGGIDRSALAAVVSVAAGADVSLAAQAARELGQFRPVPLQAVPVLVADLKSGDEGLRLAAAGALAKMEVPQAQGALPVVVEALKSGRAEIRLEAVSIVREVGPWAKSTAGLVVKMLEQGDGLPAADALGAIGPAALPAVLEAMDHADPVIRGRACLAAQNMGIAGRPALARLIRLLGDAQADVRGQAAVAIGEVACGDESAVAPLAAALADADEMFCLEAAQSLACLGAKGAPAVPGLVRLLEREAARENRLMSFDPLNIPLWALQSIGPGARAAIPSLRKLAAAHPVSAGEVFGTIGLAALPALMDMLKDRNSNVRLAAACGLEALGPPAALALPSLTRALADRDERVRMYAAHALGAIGPDAVEGVEPLARALTDPAVDVRRAAAEALGQLGPPARSALPALRKLLADPACRLAAASALARVAPDEAADAMLILAHAVVAREWGGYYRKPQEILAALGPRASAAAPVLVKALDHAESSHWSRSELSEVLLAIHPEDPAAIRYLTTRLAMEDPLEQLVAAASLLPARTAAEPARQVLERLLAYPNRHVRARAAGLLLRRGPHAAATALLREALSQDDWFLRQRAAVALARAGHADKDILDILERMLWSRVSDDRLASAEALEALGPKAAPAAHSLADRLYDRESAIRVTAGRALEKINAAPLNTRKEPESTTRPVDAQGLQSPRP